MRSRRACTILIALATLYAAAVVQAAAPAAAELTSVTTNHWLYRSYIEDACSEHGLDPALIDAVVRVESDYNPSALSRKGAMGLMQLMPATARRLSVRNPFDPEQNIRGGVRELSRLVDRYSGNLALALAAYNAGEGAVQRYRGVPPYRETRNYVSRIMTMYTGRPYHMGSVKRSVPVRLLRDKSTGKMVITNQRSSRSARVASSSSLGGASALGGGFGQQ